MRERLSDTRQSPRQDNQGNLWVPQSWARLAGKTRESISLTESHHLSQRGVRGGTFRALGAGIGQSVIVTASVVWSEFVN